MKTPEDLLQDRLEQLETGKPLAQCQQGLTSDEAELLQLANQLRQMAYPARAPQTVQQQRAHLIQQAQKEQKMNLSKQPSRPQWAFPAVGVAFAAAFLFLCVIMAAISSGYYFSNRQASNSAIINALAGVAEIQVDGNWVNVTSTTAVQVGQHLRTAPNATALLALPDGSTVYLGSATEMWIAEMEIEDNQRLIRLAQWSGETRHDVVPASATSHYEVETPTGTSQAKGTVFSVFVPTTDQTRITVLAGTVEVNGLTGQQMVTAGKMTTLSRNQPPQPANFVVIGEGVLLQRAGEYIVAGQTFVSHSETVVANDIQDGATVYVEGHIGTDGVYYADNISTSRGTGAFLGNNFTGGVAAAQTEDLNCVTVASVIVAINDNLITLENGTIVDLEQLTVLEGTPAVGSSVLLITCTDDAGNVVITILIVLADPPGEPTPTPTATIPVTITVTPSGDGTVTLCHYPPGNSGNAHTITVGAAAVPAHLAHGDTLGPCAGATPTVTITPTVTPTATATITATPPITVTPRVTVTVTPTTTVTPVPTVTPTPGSGGQVTICHVPPGNPNNPQTITVGESAVPAHLAHGDTLGACSGSTGSGNNNSGNGNSGNGNGNGNSNGNNGNGNNGNGNNGNGNSNGNNGNGNSGNGNGNNGLGQGRGRGR